MTKYAFDEIHLTKLIWWILEREQIRRRKEQGMPKPWTEDPMLQQFRFCNVQREDDKVTRWIKTNWRDPKKDHPNLYIAMILARLINWPPALEDIGFPNVWNHTYYLKALQRRKMRGEQIWSGAYMVTAGGLPIPKEEAVVDMVHSFHRSKWRPQGYSLAGAWNGLQTQGVKGMGSFLAAQVVADLKFTRYLKDAEDWWTFCAPGPGSQQGLNHLVGAPLQKQWNQDTFENAVNQLRPHLPMTLSAQDTQNCLCEYAKYVRGFSRSKYPGV